MLLKECSDTFGGSYESVRQRISKDEVIKKFVIKFLAESSYDKLRQAIENEDYVGAFNAAHALKGVSQNLSFERLGKSSSDITEYLRNSNEKRIDRQKCDELFSHVSEDYRAVTEAIRQLDTE